MALVPAGAGMGVGLCMCASTSVGRGVPMGVRASIRPATVLTRHAQRAPGHTASRMGLSAGRRETRLAAAAAGAGDEAAAEVLTQEQVPATPAGKAGSEAGAPGTGPAADAPGLRQYKHILLPVMDRNPHLNEATRQALEFGTSLAQANGSDITVVVIDEDEKEDSTDHQQRLDSIRFHLGQGGFSEFALLERLGEGKMPAAVVGEVADDLGLDLVVLPMEAVHHKHIDCNLLAEFTPCPVLLLPL